MRLTLMPDDLALPLLELGHLSGAAIHEKGAHHMTESASLSRPTIYRFKVQGELDAGWAAWFEDLTVTARQDETIITGPVADQAALHGLLAKIRDLGLPLISVDRIDPDTDGEREPTEL